MQGRGASLARTARTRRPGACCVLTTMEADDILTPDELFQFDSFGWLHVPAVFTAEEVATMRELATGWLSSSSASDDAGPALQPPLEAYAGPLGNSTGGDVPGARVIRGIYHTQYGHRLFERCACDPRILRVVRALQEGDPCHVNQNLMEIRCDTDEQITFHGNVDIGDRFYEVRGADADASTVDLNTAGSGSAGRYCFSSLVNVSVSLCDVPAGQGFVSIPGSHKRGFSPPASMSVATDTSSSLAVSQSVCAGDALIFCEALWHAAAAWERHSEPRLTIFSRFWAHCSEERYRSYKPEDRLSYEGQLGDDLRQLQQPPTVRTAAARDAMEAAEEDENADTDKGKAAGTVEPGTAPTSVVVDTRQQGDSSSSRRRLAAISRHAGTRNQHDSTGRGGGDDKCLVYVTEPAGIRRYKYPVSMRLDLHQLAPSGSMREGSDGSGKGRLRVVDVESGEEVAVQVDGDEEEEEDSASDRHTWCELHFHCSLEVFETRMFSVNWAMAAGTATPPPKLNGMSLTVEEEPGAFIVRNGDAISWRIPADLSSGIISSVLVPPLEYVDAQPHDRT